MTLTMLTQTLKVLNAEVAMLIALLLDMESATAQ